MADNKGGIPVFLVEGDTLPEAWEKSVLKVWEEGASIRTEYDKEGSPPSKDATMTFVVRKPFSEPRLHRAFPGGIEELEKYRLEVVEGIHDHWIKPEEGKWTYTYHGRLFNYAPVEDLSSSKVKSPFQSVNQIEYVIKKLSETPHSRRAQATTWMPSADPKTYDCPCLQRLWFRIIEVDGVKELEMNSHWRSRDAYKAAFMNIYALTDLQRTVAERISKNRGEKVEVRRYADISDSYHIYGFYFEEFERSFLKLVKARSFEKRTWRSDDRTVQYGIKQAHKMLEEERKKEGGGGA